MSSAPSIPTLKRQLSAAPSSENVRPVEIVAPDQLSSALLMEYAAPVFPAAVVSGSGSEWIVILQPPPTGGRWVLGLLALVERWLESARLPCADVRYGGRSYMIRARDELAGA